MSIKSKVFAAAATLTLFGGVVTASALTAGTANAETPSCGFLCIDVFSKQFSTHFDPSFLVDVYRQGNRVGQPIILFRISNGDPAEDFTINTLFNPVTFLPYTVAQFQAIDPVFSPATLIKYANDFVYENQYSPFGVNSGLCVGVANTPTNGEGVTLQGCGESAKTLWITDDFPGETFGAGYVPLINGDNTNFSTPYVLTYPQEGYPTDLPRPELTVHTLETFSSGFPSVVTNQLWGAVFGEHT
jgi:hypothetical protein